MQNVDTYIKNIIEIEGGYVNNPADKGGETNHGITYRTARNNGYNGSMINLSIDKAVEIYKNEYWLKPNFDKVYEVDNQLSFMLFQFGVLVGASTASKMLQRALNVLTKDTLPMDGNIGGKTISTLKLCLSEHAIKDSIKVLRGIVMSQQSVYLIECAEKNPVNKQFEYGWQLNRIIAVGF